MSIEKIRADCRPASPLLNRASLHLLRGDAGFETADQKAFVFVLRKNERIGERTDPLPHVANDNATLRLASDPQVGAPHLEPAIYDFTSKIYLIVEFKDARMHHKRPRGSAWRGRLVHDSHSHPEMCEPQRENKSGRPRAHDQDLAIATAALLGLAAACHARYESRVAAELHQEEFVFRIAAGQRETEFRSVTR
jgi:hypothetical protein